MLIGDFALLLARKSAISAHCRIKKCMLSLFSNWEHYCSH